MSAKLVIFYIIHNDVYKSSKHLPFLQSLFNNARVFMTCYLLMP